MSNGQSNAYNTWTKYILSTHPKLPHDCRRPVLLAFCMTLASHGQLGLNCYTGNLKLAEELGINRKYLKKYREVAVELGWFKPTGEVKGKGHLAVLDINIPGTQPDAYHESGELVSDKPKKPAKPLAETPPVVDPWATNGVTKVEPKPVPGPGTLWGEAAMQAEQAEPAPITTPVFFGDARDNTEPAPWDLSSTGESASDDPWAD